MPDLFGQEAGHQAGGSVFRPLQPGVVGDAVFSLDRRYRYRLSRSWDSPGARGHIALVVMMNPSTAEAHLDDSTVAKVQRIVRRWPGFGAVWIGNAFAYRATDQGKLAEVEDPIGPDNDWHLLEMAHAARVIIMAYGTPKVPALRERGPAVARLMVREGLGHRLRVFRLSPRGGVPMHPLYLPDNIEPHLWRPA